MESRYVAGTSAIVLRRAKHLLLITDAHHSCRMTVAAHVAAEHPQVAVYPVPPDAATLVGCLRQDRRAVIVLSCCDGSLHPLALLADVRGQVPRARVVVLTDVRGLSFEYCAGRLKPDAIVRSVVQIVPVVEAISAPIVPELRPGVRPLTPRETEVVQHVAAGLRNAEIARLIGIAEKTVKVNLTNIYCKLGIHGRGELAAMASQLLSPALAHSAANM